MMFRRRRRDEAGVDLTPLIDVVFLLIIFFLVSSHLAKQEGQLELPLPEAESGSQLTDDGSPRAVRSSGTSPSP